MSIWAIVPAKPFEVGKSRLEGVLGTEQRIRLNRWFLHHVLEAVAQVKHLSRALVISRSAEVLDFARRRGAAILPEGDVSDLNEALRLATAYAIGGSAQIVMIIPIDLPLLTAQDIEELLSAAREGSSLALAADRSETGTNGLLVPAGGIRYRFGPGSLARHLTEAQSRGLSAAVLRTAGWGLDIDNAADYTQLVRSHPGVASCVANLGSD